jgi:hypothetical protein
MQLYNLVNNLPVEEASMYEHVYIKADDYLAINCPRSIWNKNLSIMIPPGLSLKTEHVEEKGTGDTATATKVHFLNATIATAEGGKYDYWPFNKAVDKRLPDKRSLPFKPFTNRTATLASFSGAIARFATASKKPEAFLIHTINEAIRLHTTMKVPMQRLKNKMESTALAIATRRPSTFDLPAAAEEFMALVDNMITHKWTYVTHEHYCRTIQPPKEFMIAGLPRQKYRTVKYRTLLEVTNKSMS